MLEELIASEKEDLKDLKALRGLLGNNADGLRIVADLHARKTERVTELNELLRYKGDAPWDGVTERRLRKAAG